jgi:hypothetical protein
MSTTNTSVAKAGALLLSLASFGAGCGTRPLTGVDVEKALTSFPLDRDGPNVPEHAQAATPQLQEVLDQVIRGEKLLEMYRRAHSPAGEGELAENSDTLEVGKDHIAPRLHATRKSIDSALRRLDLEFTPRQVHWLEESSKSLIIVAKLLQTTELRIGNDNLEFAKTTNFDRLYEAQANLERARFHLSGAIK